MARGEITILTAAGMLGYGIPVEWFRKGIEARPDLITVDSGSTDSGPQKLGLGVMTCSRDAYMKDLSLLLEAGATNNIPVYISSAGGDGSDRHVDDFVEMATQIARHRGYRFRTAAIYAEMDRDLVRRRLREGRISPCGPVEALTEEEVEGATTIVAQMGAEPFLKALDEYGPLDLIVSGRAYDPVPIATPGLRAGFDPALCWHMGKIMECGASCAEPNGRSILGVLREDHFELEPLNPAERCTVHSVAAHTLYEKAHPYFLPGPGGMLDLSASRYDQVTDRRVRVAGSLFDSSGRYTVKLEGARPVAYRSIFIAGARDPRFIKEIDTVVRSVTRNVQTYFADIAPPSSYQMIFHVYGKNGVMGEFEPLKEVLSHELCIILEVAAPSQDLATAICGRARTQMLHSPYPGKMGHGGNLASPFTPLEIPLGEACRFNIYHLMEVDDPTEHFPIRYLEI